MEGKQGRCQLWTGPREGECARCGCWCENPAPTKTLFGPCGQDEARSPRLKGPVAGACAGVCGTPRCTQPSYPDTALSLLDDCRKAKGNNFFFGGPGLCPGVAYLRPHSSDLRGKQQIANAFVTTERLQLRTRLGTGGG